jgi:predicted DNA-binding transcriptional regulator YafY
MEDHKKMYRLFQLISRLRSPYGVTKQRLASDFEVSERTIERYFLLLRELGFEIKKKDNFFIIPRADKSVLNPENLIVFSLEEAATIRDAIENSSIHNPFQRSLLSKLYALTDLDDLSETLFKQGLTINISLIRKSIKNKERILLKGYCSASSGNISDRLVEPIKLFSYYQYLLAYEISTQKVKQYKVDRIGTVENSGENWAFEKFHGNKKVDAFGMSGTTPISVSLKLSQLAYRLMIEEFPDTAPYIAHEKVMPTYNGYVYSYKGIGRFIMGLLNEVEVVYPYELADYISSNVNLWLGKQSEKQNE